MTKPKKMTPRAKYLLSLSTDQDPVTDKNIPVYESLHHMMKGSAVDSNVPLYKVYADASRNYLENSGFSIPGLGSITPDEKLFLEDALRLYRNRLKNQVHKEIVESIKTMIRLANNTKM